MSVLLTGAVLALFIAPPWLTAVALGVTAYYGWKRHQTLSGRRAGPGASSAARARHLRTPLVRLATAVGVQTEAARLADRCDAGAAGERHVAALLAELEGAGWTVLPDRALPRGEANVDLLVISPKGVVFNVDAKKWSGGHPLTVEDGRLMHGRTDVTRRLRGLHYETRTLTGLLGVRVLSVAAVIGPLPTGAELRVGGVRIIPAADLCTVLRRLNRENLPQQHPARLIDTAGRLLPPKTGR
ncbi:nuclease-related domain-containing protein [Streptomyces sp. AMCC400023]|uniref:nuclease-related domain-containing protein n=1 Tax=Streptomyces sp. AMCC400023 TaxID=2056258 RepID=UPI001F3C3BFD|nr:nuclease-related domain-containing protein [Streptomyces sp. AMCC400023]UJV42950.1 hypothetical protein CVT30_26685 [Streptomyces sp. AMCC400023]